MQLMYTKTLDVTLWPDVLVYGAGVAGRCHSATSEALASSRPTAPAMGMGQAAGTAAALAARAGISQHTLETSRLQNHLRRQGVILDRGERKTPKDKTR
jgi:hypothetical protein